MTHVTQTQAEQLLGRLRELYGTQPYDPAQDITGEQAAEAWGISPNQARRRLADEVAAGRLVLRSVVLRGKRRNVYREKVAGTAE